MRPTPKGVQTDGGPVDIDVPRDRDGSFDPVVVPKQARRLSGFDEQVLSLYAKGFTTGEVTATPLASAAGATRSS